GGVPIGPDRVGGDQGAIQALRGGIVVGEPRQGREPEQCGPVERIARAARQPERSESRDAVVLDGEGRPAHYGGRLVRPRGGRRPRGERLAGKDQKQKGLRPAGDPRPSSGGLKAGGQIAQAGAREGDVRSYGDASGGTRDPNCAAP